MKGTLSSSLQYLVLMLHMVVQSCAEGVQLSLLYWCDGEGGPRARASSSNLILISSSRGGGPDKSRIDEGPALFLDN